MGVTWHKWVLRGINGWLSTQVNCDNRYKRGCIWRTMSTITRWTQPARHAPLPRRGSPATPAAAAKEAALTPDRCAERVGLGHDRRRMSQKCRGPPGQQRAKRRPGLLVARR